MNDIRVRNNVKVIEGDGPALLYVHGFGCNQNMWDRVTPRNVSMTLRHQGALI